MKTDTHRRPVISCRCCQDAPAVCGHLSALTPAYCLACWLAVMEVTVTDALHTLADAQRVGRVEQARPRQARVLWDKDAHDWRPVVSQAAPTS